MRRKLELSIPVALILLLLPMEACANRVASSGGFENLVSSCCVAAGLYYLGVSGQKIFKVKRDGKATWRDALLRSGAAYFLGSGCLLVVLPFLARNHMNPLIISGIVTMLAPWVTLLCVPRYKHLHGRAVAGLLTLPVVVIVLATAPTLIPFLAGTLLDKHAP